VTVKLNEALIRDQIAKTINLIDPTLTLLKKEKLIPNRIGTKSFIDLFAKDAAGRYVVIEIKRTDAAAREAAHEILKYLDGVKRHLSLRDDEIRIIVVAVEWRELILPFSSLTTLVSCPIEGQLIHTDRHGKVLRVEPVKALELVAERLIAPWHNLYFYADEPALTAGLASVRAAFATKGVDDYIVLRLEPAEEYSDGLIATKQATMWQMLGEMAATQGVSADEVELPRYKGALYTAMQQLSNAGYETLISALDPISDELQSALSETDEEARTCALHECLTGLEPYPKSDFVEIAYPAKFQTRLDEGWVVAEIVRNGSFARNTLLTDETIIEEIKGGQGVSQQKYRKTFSLADKAQVRETKRGVETCLRDNRPWREQILTAIDHAAQRHPNSPTKIVIFNPSAGLLTLYQVATQEQWAVWIPTYSLFVPPEDPTVLYFGALTWSGYNPDFEAVMNEHFDGDIQAALWLLVAGGYTERDVSILASLGLRYRSFRVDIDDDKRSFYRMTDGHWKACDPLNSFTAIIEFVKKNPQFIERLVQEYGTRWDGGLVNLS